MFHQHFEDAQFPCREFDGFPVATHATPGRIETNRTDHQRRAGTAMAASDQRPQASRQLIQIHRFDQVIICTGSKTGQLVMLRIPRRQHQHGYMEALAPQLLQQGQAIESRQA